MSFRGRAAAEVFNIADSEMMPVRFWGIPRIARVGAHLLRFQFTISNDSALAAQPAPSSSYKPQGVPMTVILGISGSLRTRSLNSALLRAAAQTMPAGSTLEIGDIKGIPLYDGDIEAGAGIPQSVKDLKERIAAADGLLLATPEYNNSLPGVLKNAIDWLSRPPADIPRIFGNRPVALAGVSPGGFGTVLAQSAWLPVLRALGTRPWFGSRLLVPRAGTLFNEAGELTDAQTREQVKQFMEGFVAFARQG
jgi:chromate reductase